MEENADVVPEPEPAETPAEPAPAPVEPAPEPAPAPAAAAVPETPPKRRGRPPGSKNKPKPPKSVPARGHRLPSAKSLRRLNLRRQLQIQSRSSQSE